MDKKIKATIKKLWANKDKFPSRIWSRWSRILWLQADESLGITFNEKVIWKSDWGVREDNWQNFFRKSSKKWNEKQIRERLRDYMLLLKQDQLTAQDVLQCRNVEIRSHLLKQFGHERLFRELGGKLIHHKGDAELYRLHMGKSVEDIQIVKVKDSSTGQFYLLRVPLTVKTCKEAVAWTFGFSGEEYDPVKET